MRARLLFLPFLFACHGHEHGAHGHGAPPEEDPRPGISVTLYQGPLELFMEYPAFVAGQESPLIAHFTDTRDPEAFHPVVRGQMEAILRYEDGTTEKFRAEKTLRDGIFKPITRPSKAGNGTLTLVLTGDQVAGTVEVGPVVVHANVQAAVAAEEPESASGEQPVPYLKEQQWKTVYATSEVENRSLRASVRVFGELRAAAGRQADLTAPVGGRVEIVGTVPRLGQRVRRGDLFLKIAPSSAAGGADRSGLELEERRARAELGLAEREYKRARELFATQAIPEKQVDAARVAVEVAQARLRTAEAQLAAFRSVQGSVGSGRGTAYELRAPFDGAIASVSVMPGAFVAAGAPLLGIVDTAEIWLVAHVPEQDLAVLPELGGAGFRLEGQETENALSMEQWIGEAPVLDVATRSAEVVFTVLNPGGALRPGSSARVTLYGKPGAEGPAVARQAVVDDNGFPTVFVMDGGEGFFKRRIRVGPRDGEWLAVVAGLEPGDRVVSRGAYEVKLSTTAGAIPAHGHQH